MNATREMNPNTSAQIVTLHVSSIDASIELYCGALGYELQSRSLTRATLRNATTHQAIQLRRLPSAEELFLAVDDLDETIATIQDAGGNVIPRPDALLFMNGLPDAGREVCVDADGNLIHLTQRKNVRKARPLVA